ncbi:MAG: UDP-N-acetylmuramate--L-alanine ligase, partial [Candidatus Omnitrophica bacterium]|nr:UDP-N-acetylmuramate--L-alanine ligase [Candidatus Omnitrophota bacterium]
MSKHYHLIGIGGIGMGTIASLLLDKGYRVSGSDVRENATVNNLMKKGAAITIGHNSENIVDADVVVYSSAIKDANCELAAAHRRGMPVLQRAQVLVELMREHTAITVAGAHGKTTTTSMIGQMLALAGLEPTTAIGGIVKEGGSNASLGKGQYFVAEVDESDGSFLYFSPDYSIINNMDLEHLDYYQNWKNIADTYHKFFELTSPEGLIIAFGDDHRLCDLIRLTGRPFKTFGFSSEDDVFATNIRMKDFQTSFDCVINGTVMGSVEVPIPGRHNIANALACLCLGAELGIDFTVMANSLRSFGGVQRRFESIGVVEDIAVIDDYAHHPTEILATLQTAHEQHMGRVIGIFQPHRFTRLKALWKEFIESLKDVDYLIVTDVYAASENPLPGIDGAAFVSDLKKISDHPVLYVKQEKIVNHLFKIGLPGDLVITLGAGDVNQ